MLKVTDVDYVKEYKMILTFNDGKRKLVDLFLAELLDCFLLEVLGFIIQHLVLSRKIDPQSRCHKTERPFVGKPGRHYLHGSLSAVLSLQ